MLKPISCQPCPLFSISDGYILSEGEGTNGVVILGEAGGWNEYLDNLPFRPKAQAGSKLEEVFKLVGQDIGQPVSRNQFKIYNTVNCHPPGDKLAGESYESGAIACCSSNVDAVINSVVTPFQRTVLALGNIPLKVLTGFSGVAEEKQSISYLRGFVFQSKYGLVVPSYHPSFVRRGNNHLTPMLVEDMKKALMVARGLFTNHPYYKEWQPPRYQTSPGLDEIQSFYYRVKDSPRLILTYDIETPQTGLADEDERDDLENLDIVQVQFSLRKNEGIALDFNRHREIVDRIFALPNVKANHNTWNFDNPRLKAKGVVINGKVHDTMWMFKHWHPRLPRGLQSASSLFGFPLPWKHMYSSNLQWYGCADVDAVQYIIHILPQLMQAKGIWKGYVEHVYNVNPIFTKASERGIPVSVEKHKEVAKILVDEREKIDKELQGLIPDECRNIRPKRKDKETGEIDYGYVREPKTVGEEFERYERLSKELLARGKSIVSFEEYIYRKHNIAYCEFKRVVDGNDEIVKRWAVIEPFKASKEQLVKYLRWKQGEVGREIESLRDKRDREYGGRNPEITGRINELRELFEDYEIPVDLKSKRETTSKKELEEMFLNTGDPVLEKVVKIRSLDTNLNNYLPNWYPSRDGRVHPVYGYTAPQGQINSWRPNSQNVSKHTEFGNEFRGIVVAKPGKCFVEFDKKSFHVATMGYCANDKDYIRFSQIDPHSILGSYIDPSIIGCSISLKWSDDEIKVAAKEFKKRSKEIKAKDPIHGVDVRQELAKPTVLGNQLELGPKKLQRQNRRFIHYVTERERKYFKGEGYSAEGLQNIINELFHKEKVYKEQIKERAHLQKWLTNEFGRIQYFYDVFNFVFNKRLNKWDRRDGDGARHPIAFRVQSTAFGMITEELLEFERVGACEEHEFLVTIHDSLMFHCEIGKRDKLIELGLDIMNRPCKKLVNEATGPEGLKVGVETSVGRNWKGFDEVKNVEGMREI